MLRNTISMQKIWWIALILRFQTIDAVDSVDFVDNYAGGLIADIYASYSTDCANILISDDMADELIATAINSDDLADCADNAACGLISAI